MSFDTEHTRLLTPEVVIFGSGVAGLWLANRLHRLGYQVLVFEKSRLGGIQTMASQGMIHGGMKYTLGGALSGASEAIAAMPQHWRQCLCGEGEVDLRQTRILSDYFFLWSGETLGSRLTGFFASKLIRGRVEAVDEVHRPSLLRHPEFTGSLYRVGDMVLDVPSLITDLARPLEHRLLQLPEQARLHREADGRIAIHCPLPGESLLLRPRHIVLAAGEGNETLLQQLDITRPAMQRRPLQQVMVKHSHLHRFYGHCLGNGSTPRVTISSHPTADGRMVWYLGGQLAEEGANRSAEELITFARAELADLMPWLDFSDAEWATLPVQRAEPRQPGLARPDNAWLSQVPGIPNLLVGWPTKLTLAPNMANQALALLQQQTPRPTSSHDPALLALSALLPPPPLAHTPWDEAFPPSPFEVPESDDSP